MKNKIYIAAITSTMAILVGVLAYGYYLETYDHKFITKITKETMTTSMTGEYRSMRGCQKILTKNGLTSVVQDTPTQFVGLDEHGSTMTCLQIGTGPASIINGKYSLVEPTTRALRAQMRLKQLARQEAGSWTIRSEAIN